MADFVITGARIIDPANGIDTSTDLYVQDGRVVHVGGAAASPLGGAGAARIMHANECVVTPGLVDLHVHAYEHVTPLGIGVDARCLARGVTTAVDAGSAGCATLKGLRKFICEPSRCRLLAFLHVASHGLASAGCSGLKDGGEIDSLSAVDVESCVAAARDNRDLVVGIKLRMSSSIADLGKNEQEAYRRALQASEEAGIPLMVHHTMSTVPTVDTEGILSCPGSLKEGDIFTHCFHWHKSCLLDRQTGKLLPDVWRAKRRGVLFDVGHGFGSFGWREAEACAAEGFWPDVISTDLHTASVAGPAYDLAAVMTRMLHVGMPLPDVIKAVTATPAKAIGRSHQFGSLTVGLEADITVLKVEACDIELEDTRGETRRVRKRIVPVRVFRAGVEHPIQELRPFPSPESREKCRLAAEQYTQYESRDSQH